MSQTNHEASEPTESNVAPPPPVAAYEDEGPQPGNAAPPPHVDDDEDGPAPGNEKFPTRAATPPRPDGQPRARKRRRQKRKPDGSVAPHEASPGGPQAEPTDDAQPVEGSQPDATAARPHAASRSEMHKDRPHGRREHGPKGDPTKRKGPRPDHGGFHIGDVTVGRIVRIEDEAVFVDLHGKATAVFDRRELAIPELEPDATPVEAPAEADAQAPETAEVVSEEVAPAEVQAEEPGILAAADIATSTEPDAAVAAAESDAHGSGAQDSVTGNETSATEPEKDDSAAVATDDAEEHDDVEAKHKQRGKPREKLPPVILEQGAYFVGIVHNDGGRGGNVVLTRHPERVSAAKQAVFKAFRDKTPVSALVTGVIRGGVDVDVDGLRAFAPASQMTLRPGSDLRPYVGQRLDFDVTNYAKRGRDVVLSRRSVLEAEAKTQRDAAIGKLAVGSVVEGTVRSVVEFGAFIDLGEIEGLVPRMEMSHNRSDGPSDVFKVGERVSVKITKLDDRGKVYLSRRAVVPDPWLEAVKKYAVGSKHEGKVVRLQPFGAFVELESGVDGLIHTADLSPQRIEKPEDVVKVGDAITVVVSALDASTRKIGLHPALTGASADEAPQRVGPHKVVKVVVVAIDPNGLAVRVRGVTGRNARGFIPASATGTPRGTELRKSFTVGQEIEAKVVELDPRRGEVKLSIRAMTEQAERDAYQQYKQQVTRESKFTIGDMIAKKAGK